MASPTDRRYSESHEWHKLDGDILTLGLSKFAIDELTDITYVELKPVGTSIDAGGEIGEVESVKATSDVYSSIAGEIIEVNESLDDDPSVLNSDPYEAGWLVRIKVSDTGGLDALMDSSTYDQKHSS
ncbi:MAG: glycine cleavage system protein GcvH [Planctomycetota bacterium]|jgi:glycine cleavage system H protein